MILIDTSAWIDFFRGRNPCADRVDKFLDNNQAAICGPIAAELMRGFRNEAERRKVWPLLLGCRQLAQPEDLWAEAGEIGFLLKRGGQTVKTMDLLIAVYASAHRVPLLTQDKDFLVIRDSGVSLEIL